MMGSAGALVSMEKYLGTSYRPDRDFLDGVLEKRNLGDYPHGRMQALLAGWFGEHEEEWGVVTLAGIRIRVAAQRVRVADICLLRRDAPREKVIVTPPVLCVEVLSPEDRLPRAAKVMEDYARMGVQDLWLIDPLKRVGYVYRDGEFLEISGDKLESEATGIHVQLGRLYASLN